ncbi:MAG: hypothetical protein HDR14_14110 [Lachnospiraceae bacterium]|nr:hypothetical protein [Lachnospiraceae bacterium]
MRKQNSDFSAAFVSEAGNQLKNSDYFGFVELDEYACYVIADGITDLPGTESARLAIETVILHFQENPSMSGRRMRRLIAEADKALNGRDSYKRQEASLTVILTDYRSFRYGYLGNTRMRMYRGGQVFRQTEDMSLAQEFVEQEKVAKDALQEHEERNNLYAYLGQGGAKPRISKKIKLLDTDIITLYTRGIWENLDEAELDDVFSEAGNEVQDSLDDVEELLLSKQPQNLENYTFAAIFINKVYSDPAKAKKRKKIIIFSILAVVLVIAVVCICIFLHQRRLRRISDMNFYFTNTVEYINTGNFVRAKEECGKAEELAVKLKDNEMRGRLQEYLFVIETVLLADENFAAGSYGEAQNYYKNALDRARYADFIGETYMEDKLDKIADYLSVMDYIALGDMLLEKAEYEKAEGHYLAAKKLASASHYTEGTEAAMSALEKLYTQWAEAEAASQQLASEQAEKEVAAAELTANGDKACLERDFAGAEVYYTMALTKYQELGDIANEQYIQQKLDSVAAKAAEEAEKRKTAENLEWQGMQAQGNGDYWSAKSFYLQAKKLYLELGSDTDVERLANLAEQMDALTGAG